MADSLRIQTFLDPLDLILFIRSISFNQQNHTDIISTDLRQNQNQNSYYLIKTLYMGEIKPITDSKYQFDIFWLVLQ